MHSRRQPQRFPQRAKAITASQQPKNIDNEMIADTIEQPNQTFHTSDNLQISAEADQTETELEFQTNRPLSDEEEVIVPQTNNSQNRSSTQTENEHETTFSAHNQSSNDYCPRHHQLHANKHFEEIINSVEKSEHKIHVQNEIDLDLPPMGEFEYIKESIPRDIEIKNFPRTGCGCKDQCTHKSKSCCPFLIEGEDAYFAYAADGKLRIKRNHAIYECNSKCQCTADCQNRVVQNGRKLELCIFKSPIVDGE